MELFDSDVSNKRDITGAFDTEIKERIPNYVIYDIFLLFCFQDNIRTIFQTCADNPLIKFIEEIRTKSLEEKRRIKDYNSTIDLMTALLAFYHYLRANNVSVPSELDRKIDTYYHDLDHYKRIKENPDFKYNVDMEKAKLARQYNIIAKILELGIERQERKKKTNTSRVIISPLQVP